MSAPIALIDANVLYDAVLRDLVMQSALSGLLRPRWTRLIDDEWTRNLLANRPDITPAQLDATRHLMARAVPDGLVEGFETHVGILDLPDPDDRHVLAAAIESGAHYIVTLNLRDFPPTALTPYGIVASTPDDVLSALCHASASAVIATARECRARLTNPVLSAERYLAILARHGLSNTTRILSRHLDQL